MIELAPNGNSMATVDFSCPDESFVNIIQLFSPKDQDKTSHCVGWALRPHFYSLGERTNDS